MDLGTILSIVNFIFGNPVVLVGIVMLFAGWNLPQPAYAKMIQDKVVAGAKWLWSQRKKQA